MADYRLYPFEFGILSPEQVVVLTPFFKGDPGQTFPGGGNDSYYEHDQSVASALWTVNHGLFKFPSVTIVDSAGDVVEGEIHHVSIMQLTVSFSAAFAGKAYIN
jgi:hypothetical protein